MNNLKQIDSELNDMTRAGQILEALDRFYAEECTFQEGNKEPLVGRKAHRSPHAGSFRELDQGAGPRIGRSAASRWAGWVR